MSLPQRRLVSLVLLCAIWGAVGVRAKTPPVYAQGINPELLYGQWSARWIAPPDAPPDGYGVYHFRRAFDLASQPRSFVIHVTGDNRYELFVNGVRAAAGPARGDPAHWRFEAGSEELERILDWAGARRAPAPTRPTWTALTTSSCSTPATRGCRPSSRST
jgi:hypothetical protein